MRRLLALLIMATACCEGPAPPGAAAPVELTTEWQRDKSAVHSITAYSFHNPSTRPNSILRGGSIDFSRLARLTTAERSPDRSHRDEILSAILDPHSPVTRSDCYIPHHLFLLRARNRAIIGAIEVCFSCRTVVTVPPLPREPTPEWTALAEQCVSLGLGLGPNFDSVAEFKAALDHDSP